MLSGLAIAVLAGSSRLEVASLFADGQTLVVETPASPLPSPKKSPLNAWEFDTVATVSVAGKSRDGLRFRVFGRSDSKNPTVRPAAVARLLARLYDFNYSALRLDHSPEYGRQRIDVYLCPQGQAGGQQMFTDDPDTSEGSGPNKVNVFYIFDVETLDDKVEALRELAHEYGHATLPPVKVKQGREDWANGDVGERVYLPWLQSQLSSGRLSPDDLMGVGVDGLAAYARARVNPLIDRMAARGVDLALLAKPSVAAFDEYVALMTYCGAVLPIEVFRRALVLNPDQSAPGAHRALMDALKERSRVEFRVDRLSGRTVWLPVADRKTARALAGSKKPGWIQVKVSGPVVATGVVKN